MDLLSYVNRLRDRKKANYLVIFLILIFLVLSAIVLFLPTGALDLKVSEEVQEDITPLLSFLMHAISWFGTKVVAVVLVFGTALVLLLAGHKRDALFVISTASIWLITLLIKIGINRPRPTADLVEIMEVAAFQSFPSGHTSFYTVFFGFIVFLMLRNRYLNKPFRYTIIILSLLLIFSVPFSRIYLGAHWFTDVVAGFILGVLVLYAIIRIYIRVMRIRREQLRQHASR